MLYEVITLDFMRIDKNSEPDKEYIRENLANVIADNEGADIYITQGFICRNAFGEIDNLQRGGSDYSASLIGAAIKADEIQIWTDIDGMHNNDPRFVEKTHSISDLSFDEARITSYNVCYTKLLRIPSISVQICISSALIAAPIREAE